MYIWLVVHVSTDSSDSEEARQDFPGGLGVKNLPASTGDTGLISGPEVPTMLGGN